LRDNASHFVLAGILLAGAGTLITPAHADDAPIVLGPVKVEDQNSHNNNTHGTGLNVLPSTIQDTPQAINVIGQEQMRQQGVTSLEQALRNVPGITVSIGEGGTLAGDQFKIRGFDAKDDVYLDGLRDFGAYTRDSFNYEEVQVLQGPSGSMFGRGTSGGAINVISKAPTMQNRMDFDAYVGNGDYYRALADVNQVIGDNVAIRVTGMVAHTGVVDRDVVKSDRWGIAPSIAFGLGTDTSFTLSWMHQHDNRIPDYGIVIAQNPASVIGEPASEYGVPRNTFTGYNTDRDVSTADLITARLNHQATPWLTLTSDTRVGVYSRYFQYTTVDRCDFTSATSFCSNVLFGATPTAALAGIGGSGPYSQNAWGAQNISTARADFDIGGFKNQLIGGFDVSYQTNDKLFYAYTLPPVSSGIYTLGTGTQSRANIGIVLFNPVHTPPPGYAVFLPNPTNITNSTATLATVLRSTGNATDYAAFLTDRLWLTPDWSVIAGFRYDDYLAHYNTTTVGGTQAPLKSKSGLFNPRASLVWEPGADQTYYVSWGRSAIPQGTSIVGAATAIAATMASLDPEKSQTFEIGGKVSLFDDELGLSGSLFNIQKSNAQQIDPVTGDAIVQSGERDRVRGFQLQATGEVVEGLTVNAAYTFLDSKITSDLSCSTATAPAPPPFPPIACLPNPITVGQPVINVPRHAASLWSTYDLAAWAPGLSAGGGMTYQSDMNVRYTTSGSVFLGTLAMARIARIPQTLTFDGYFAYQMDQLRFALNVQNIGDALYYAQSFGNRGTPAPGRTFLFSVSWAPQ
jgi:catecholate siderophore receptor